MPDRNTQDLISSDYNQESFIGGMSLLGDDTRLSSNQYRIGFNITNRLDELSPILQSMQDVAIPCELIQELVTFGNYLILFGDGSCWFRYYNQTGWTLIEGFQMSITAPRFWTCAVPVSTTNYIRYAATGIINTNTNNAAGAIQLSSVIGASAGNLPGLIVQDNINQPFFIFIGSDGIPEARITQKFTEWSITYTDATNTVVGEPDNNLIPNGAIYVNEGANSVYQVPLTANQTWILTAGANETSGNVAEYSVDGVNWTAFGGISVTIPQTAELAIRLSLQANQTNVTASVTAANTAGNSDFDSREYVPIGNSMAWSNGILEIVSQDFNFLYRSVSGRPLDFVVNVTNHLAANDRAYTWIYIDPITSAVTTVIVPPFTQSAGGAFDTNGVFFAGGDATTTSYSVGIGGITCIRPLSTGGWFVAAGLANFSVTLNTTPNAPTLYGEYTFLRNFMFNATCLTDRAIFDSLGDTRFIDLTGVRSFNAILQQQNEGKNSVFSSAIYAAFGGDLEDPETLPSIIQDPSNSAAILFDNYELYAVNTIFGPAIAKWDTVNGCWVGFDNLQVDGSLIKIFAKIELTVQALYAVTENNRLYQLYAGPSRSTGLVRTIGISSNLLYANSNIKMNNPKSEMKLSSARVINNKITDNGIVSVTPYINNRLSTTIGTTTKNITYKAPVTPSVNTTDLPDVNTQLSNLFFNFPNCEQGWKTFCIISWTQGVITQYSFQANLETPINPPTSQVNTQ